MARAPSMAGLQREVDRVDAKVNLHEAECALRYQQINEKLDGFKETLDSNHRRSGRVELAAWSLLVAIIMLLLGVMAKGGLA
ncbi:hypothetical protein [Brevundimonas sp.]|uniref:hypothetical protein n=1 Tax=Brevundimonas sp. TaxID=1871086 RepID=UPI0035B2BD73